MTAENQVIGRPYVVLHVDHDRYAVNVLQHARTLEEALATANETRAALGPDHALVLTHSRHLTSKLQELRTYQAERLGHWIAS